MNANRAIYKRSYKILLFLIPALLLAIGALIWIYLFKSEFKKVNNSAISFGDDDLSSRIKLSKNSSLFPIAESFNNMAARIQKLVNGQHELTNAVSHELKTPLSRLHYALELQKTSISLEEREKYTDKIEDNIASLEALVDELLTYSRLQTTRSLNLKTYKTKAWLSKELDVFVEYHPNIKIELDCDNSDQSDFDKLLLSRALNNLLENAAYYADKNHPEIKVTSIIKNNKTIINIEDNGKGIKESDRAKIFEPFTRLDPSRQRHNKNKSLGGYGIGLSIVESVMQQHKGEVYCSDSSLGGAKITLIW